MLVMMRRLIISDDEVSDFASGTRASDDDDDEVEHIGSQVQVPKYSTSSQTSKEESQARIDD